MSLVYTHARKYTEGDLARNQEIDHSNIGEPPPQQQQHCHHQHNSGLFRYPSAPSSMLTNLVLDTINNNDHDEDHHNHYLPSTTSEMETMFAKLISPNNNSNNNNELNRSATLQGYGSRTVKKEEGGNNNNNNNNGGYSFGSNNEANVSYQPNDEQVHGLPNGSLGSMNGFDGSFSAVNSMGLDNSNNTEPKIGSANCSNLIRQKSSPAGFFSNYSVDKAFRVCDVSNGQATTSSTRPSYCSMFMPKIVESGNEGIESPNCVENKRNLHQGNNDDEGINKSYMQNFTTTEFWDASAFNGSKTASRTCEIMFSTSNNNGLEVQDADFGYQKLGLTHHLSLPITSSSTKMDKFYQIQGSVPCKVRAKRGFATHPRSIAERERRTRISLRIKKLQDLFPKSDKQTSTADMLDLAVEYIKDLQKQVKILKDTRAKCTCSSSNQKQ